MLDIKNQIEELAKNLHNNYESLAHLEGWNTQDSCKVEFKDLPEANKRVMIGIAKWINENYKLREESLTLNDKDIKKLLPQLYPYHHKK